MKTIIEMAEGESEVVAFWSENGRGELRREYFPKGHKIQEGDIFIMTIEKDNKATKENIKGKSFDRK